MPKLPSVDEIRKMLLNPPLFEGQVLKGAAENGRATIRHPVKGTSIRALVVNGDLQSGRATVFSLASGGYITTGQPRIQQSLRRDGGIITVPAITPSPVIPSPASTGDLFWWFGDTSMVSITRTANIPTLATFFKDFGDIDIYQDPDGRFFNEASLDNGSWRVLRQVLEENNAAYSFHTNVADMDPSRTWLISPLDPIRQEYPAADVAAIAGRVSRQDGKLLIMGENPIFVHFNALFSSVGLPYQVSPSFFPGRSESNTLGDHPKTEQVETFFLDGAGPGALVKVGGTIPPEDVFAYTQASFDEGSVIEPFVLVLRL